MVDNPSRDGVAARRMMHVCMCVAVMVEKASESGAATMVDKPGRCGVA